MEPIKHRVAGYWSLRAEGFEQQRLREFDSEKRERWLSEFRRYLPEGSRVLIIDDFLADGEAVRGMMSLCEQQGATPIGVGIAVEKGFQPGGRKLREAGVHLKSLAIVEGIEDGKILLKRDEG